MQYHPFSDAMVNAINEGAYIVLAARLDLKSGVTCAHTGVGQLIIAGETYLGVGSLGEISQLKENKTTSPPQLQLKLAGFDKSLVGMVMNEQSRGREVRLMMAAIGEEGKPLLAEILFVGQITSINVVSGEENAVCVNVSNRFERWSIGYPIDSLMNLGRQEGKDRIFRYVAQMAERAIYWGSKKDAPAFIYK
ncbi:hypothetical protein [Proteus mirabilis]|uniref:hypothetical protein n=1 Tax=Proteus mirabilis TaxID=584 RepID=UPI0020C7BF29|nr:hypothetical protein [Proteus mirabilis]